MEISCAVRHRFLRLREDVLGADLARFKDVEAFGDFTVLTRTVAVFLDAAGGLASPSAIAACAAASRAMATRNGEQLT